MWFDSELAKCGEEHSKMTLIMAADLAADCTDIEKVRV